MQWTREQYVVDDDPQRQDMFYIMADLQQSYWAGGRSRETMAAAMAGSVCLGLYCEDRQIGFARAVTDKVTFAWVCDVMVHRDYRGVGLGKFLMDCLHEHPDLKRCRQFLLRTDDAHGLYEQFGYAVCESMVKKVDNS